MIRTELLRNAFPVLYWVLRLWCFLHRGQRPFQLLRKEIDRLEIIMEEPLGEREEA